MDEEHRPYKLWRHALGTPVEQDELLYTEEDQRMWMGIGKTDSDRFLVMELGSQVQTEVHLIDLQGEKDERRWLMAGPWNVCLPPSD